MGKGWVLWKVVHFSDVSGPNLIHVFFIARKKYWRVFIAKNQPLGQLEERVGLIQSHAFFDGFGPNLGHVFFIIRKKILAYFHVEKPTPRANGGRGGFDANSCIFRQIWIKFSTCVFHLPEKILACFYIEIQPLGQMGEGVDLMQSHAFFDGSGSNLGHVFSIPHK